MSITKIKPKSVREFHVKGRQGKIQPAWRNRLRAILDFLENARSPEDCRTVRGFHDLRKSRPGHFSMELTGNWRITFTFSGKNVIVETIEDYHKASSSK